MKKKGVKARKKRLAGGGGGALPAITPFTILGKSHYSAQTNSGLTQPNLAFNLIAVHNGATVQDVNSVDIADYEVRDYITGTLRGIAADSYPVGSPSNHLNITLPINSRNINHALYPRPAIYNPTGATIGEVTYTASVVVDVHDLVNQGIVTQHGAASVNAGNPPMFNTTFASNSLMLMFADSPAGPLPHGIASGELVIQYTATVLSKTGNTILTTAILPDADATTKQSFYLDIIVQ